MSATEKVIRVRIDTRTAEADARRLDRTVSNIGRSAASNDNTTNSFKRMGEALTGTERAGGAVSRIMDTVRGSAAAATPAVGGLVANLASMGPMAAIAATVALAIGAISSKAIEAAKQTQIWKANLLTVTKSSEAAGAAYAGLVNFANKTPFTLEQSVGGFIKLRALGLSTSEAIMTSYGNTAAAMGKSMSQMIEAVADATTGENERLKEFGIKAKVAGDMVAYTFQGVTTKVKNNAKAIQEYLVGIGTTKFGGAMARQMATISGAFSNLEDKIFLMFARMGEGEFGKTVAKIANQMAEVFGALTPLFGGIMDLIGGIIGVVYSFGTAITQIFGSLVTNSDTGYSAVEKLSIVFSVAGQAIGVLGSVAGSVFGFIGSIVGTTASYISSAFGQLFDWLVPSFQSTGQSAGESLVGILRAAQFVANQLPNIFKAALNEVKAVFIQAGAALAASLQGDFSKWGAIDLSFKNTRSAMASTWAGAKATYGNQKANRAEIDRMAGRTPGGNINSIGTSPTPGGAGAGGKPDGGASDAEKKAKAEAEFWKTLEQEAETAKRIGIEGENYKKQLELQKIIGRAVNDNEKERLNTALQLVRTNKFIGEAQEEHLKNAAKAGVEDELLRRRQAGLTGEQLERERAILEFRSAAQTKGLDLQGEAYLKQEDQLRKDLERLGVLKAQNKALDEQTAKINSMASEGQSYAKAALETNGSAAARRAAAGQEYNDQKAALLAGWIIPKDGKQMSADEFNAGMDKAGDEFRAKMAEIGTDFEQKVGRAADLLSTIGDRLGGALGKFLNKLGGIADSIKNFSANKEDIATKFTDVFGRGKLAQGIGKAVGGAVAGAEMGKQINSAMAPIAKMVGLKTSKTGAQIGGALGSFIPGLPPGVGAAIGSVVGSLFGGLLKKTKKGYANNIMVGETGAAQFDLAGNSASRKEAAGTLANGLVSSLGSIADQLGGELNGKLNLGSLGMKDKKYTFDATPGNKAGRLSFKTEEEAIAAALKNALEMGVVQGIKASTQNLLRAGDNLEAQLAKALRFEQVFKDLKAYSDPVGAAIDGLNQDMRGLAAIFKEAGASSQEYASLEQLKALKLQEIIDNSTSSLKDLMSRLNGEAGGASVLSQFNNDYKALDAYRNKLALGQQIDQDKYTSLVDNILGNGQKLYGFNSSEYQSMVSDLKGLTTSAIGNVTSAATAANANNGLDSAIKSQTDAMTQNQQVQIDIAGQTLAAIKGLASMGPIISSNYAGVNGRLISATG